jgi:predicted transcriptional regulator
LENLTEDPTSVLYGMVDTDAFGLIGLYETSTGATSGACYWPQFKATIELASFSPEPQMFYWEQVLWGPPAVKDRHVMVMAGTEDPLTHDTATTAYDAFTHFSTEGGSVVKVILPDVGNYGPWALDLIVSFVLYNLKGMDEYKTFLYGDKMLEDLADDRYWLEFQRTGSGFFPPEVHVEELPGPIYMETLVNLSLLFKGYPNLNASKVMTVDWFIDDPGHIVSSLGASVITYFPAPEDYKVSARWSIRDHYGWAFPYEVTVENMPPVADPGPDRTVNMDEEVVFDGGASWDTISHLEQLEFMWTFSDGVTTPYSNVSTHTRMLTEPGQLVANLTVRDSLGTETSETCDVIVNNVVPTVTMNIKTRALEDEALSATGEGTDTASHLMSLMYRWEFEDGSGTEWAISPDAAHTYRQEGTYNATLWAKDALGAEGKDTIQITVQNVIPEGGIDKPMDGAVEAVGTRLEFAGWGRDTISDNSSLWYTWDFGDEGTAGGAVARHTYKETGTYTVTLTIEDDDGATVVVTHYLTIDERVEQTIEGPFVIALAISLITILGVAIVAATEPGKYWFGLLSVPLFMKTKDVLDNKTRHALLGIIVTKPGIHYSAIKEEFGLANGAAAHHLHVLKREGFIRSVRDGKLKRFYLTDVKVPDGMGMSPEETRDAIVEIVLERPGISQLEIMEALELDRNEASYYLRTLVKEDRLTAGKEGRFTVYKVNGRK